MEKTVQKSTYKNLLVYQKAKDLTIKVIEFFKPHRFLKTEEFLIVQLLRAVSSVGANIAEGYGRMYKKSYRQFLSIARGSSFEADYWFEIILVSNKHDRTQIMKFMQQNLEIIKMLSSMMKKMEA